MKGSIDELVESIRDYAEQGLTREDISQMVGKSYTYILALAKKRGIEIIRKKHTWKESVRSGTLRRPEIDALLTGEYSLRQIGKKVPPLKLKKGETSESHPHISYHAVEEYLTATGQNEYFRKKKREFLASQITQKEEKEALYANLSTLLLNLLNKRLSTASWAEQKASEYCFLRDQINYSGGTTLEDVKRLLETYKQALDSGTRMSFYELKEKSGIKANLMKISGILKELNLKPFYAYRRYNTLPQDRKPYLT